MGGEGFPGEQDVANPDQVGQEEMDDLHPNWGEEQNVGQPGGQLEDEHQTQEQAEAFPGRSPGVGKAETGQVKRSHRHQDGNQRVDNS